MSASWFEWCFPDLMLRYSLRPTTLPKIQSQKLFMMISYMGVLWYLTWGFYDIRFVTWIHAFVLLLFKVGEFWYDGCFWLQEWLSDWHVHACDAMDVWKFAISYWDVLGWVSQIIVDAILDLCLLFFFGRNRLE